MCLSCHLPIKDVRANQAMHAKSTGLRRLRLGTRLMGLVAYPAAALWCWFEAPTALAFVAPAALVGGWLHVVRARPWLGLAVFVLAVTVAPLLLWPSMLTGLFADLTSIAR